MILVRLDRDKPPKQPTTLPDLFPKLYSSTKQTPKTEN
jgi:hypothetical protein